MATRPIGRLRILWISHFIPFPPKGGCFQRSYNLIKRIGAEHDVHLVALRHKRETHPDEETRNAREELLKSCRSVQIVDISADSGLGMVGRAMMAVLVGKPFNATFYRSRQVRSAIESLRASTAIDVVHFDTIGLAQYRNLVTALPAVITHHGAESHMVRTRIPHERNLLKKAFFGCEWRSLRRYERINCPNFAINITMSSEDSALMRDAAPSALFTPVENGVDVEYFAPHHKRSGRRLVFAGRLDQYSNRYGMQHFMEHAWSALQTRYPDVSIDIIGSNPPPSLLQLAKSDPAVRVHGFVPDVRPYFEAATVAVCPLWDGGGTRLKVLDALAQGVPLVATTIGCEGLEVVPERDVLIADSAAAFVKQIGRLFDDPTLRRDLSVRGRDLVERRYSWDSLARKLVTVYRSALGEVNVTPMAPFQERLRA
jgi:glycosyltransferase involved in cell wall biosynthesis